MQSLIRICLLGVCSAAGIGLAVSLALTLAPSDSPSPVTAARNEFSPASSAAPPVAKTETPAAATAPTPPAPPVLADYQPAVTQQVNSLEQAIRRFTESTQSSNSAIVESLQALQERVNQPAAPGAPPAPGNLLQAPGPAVPAQPQLPPQLQPAERLPDPAATSSNAVVVRRAEGDDNLTVDVRNGDIRAVLALISEQSQLNILASKNVTGGVSASLGRVSANQALEAILKSTGFVARREGNFIYVGTPEDLQDMDRAQDQINTRVYRPNYVRAAELQALITPLISQGVGKISVSTASEMDIPADTVKTGGNSFAGTDVVIVRDYEAVLRQIDQMVAEVDIQPRQVAIEAMILSVKLDDEFEFGVDWQLFRDQNNVRLVSGSPLANLANFNLTGDGLRFGFLDSSTSVFVNALETVGETNVVAAPRVLCLNKQRAEILIGSQLGYVSTTVTENASTQSIEFLEVGTQLRIRPYIYNDGSLRLEVHPELSTGNVRVESGFTLPDKEVTQVTTNIMCRDGSTIVIGGLIREDQGNQTTQIPFLGSLPYVGAAFRQKTETTNRHEIIVLITPRLVAEPGLSGEGTQVQREFAVRQANFADKMSPIGKRHYGRHYLRLAYAAWNAGDARVALRYANLAVHFDPMNLEASNLRSQVAGTMPEYDNKLHNYLKDGLRPYQHPVRDYTRHGYPWSPGNPTPQDEAEVSHYHAYDPGVPGRVITLDNGLPPVRHLEPETPEP